MASSSTVLTALLLLLFLRHARASFAPEDLRGMYIFRFGAGSCPARLTFSVDSLSIPPQNISINDSACTDGTLTAATNPASADAGLLARYLRGTKEAGDFVVATVEQNLVCPQRTFGPDVRFVFTAADKDFTVSWTTVFESNNTFLGRKKDSFEFERGKQHLIINSLCMFDRIDIPNPPGRKCFPAAATVLLRDGHRVRMSALATGDEVAVGAGRYSRVVGFTHASEEVAPVVRLQTRHGTLAVSPGHFVYADGKLTRAGDVRVGMYLTRENGAKDVVDRVHFGLDRGLYNPQTADGNVVVDGFVCSCYTDAVQPAAAHALLAPVRAIAVAGVDLLRTMRVF